MDINKHLTEDQIAIFVEALEVGSESSLPEEWRDHVSECAECAYEINMVSTLLSKDKTGKITPKKEKSVTSKVLSLKAKLSIAASIAILISSGILLLIVNTNQNIKITEKENISALADSLIKKDTEKTAQTVDKPKKEKEPKKTKTRGLQNVININKDQSSNRKKLAYIANEKLEKLVARSKDSNLRSNEIYVISASEMTKDEGDKIILKFNNPKEINVIIEFFDNKGKKLFDATTNSEDYNPQKLVKPGLYYWKLLDNEFYMVFCGKIIIRKT
jgi:hypothetical protein